MNKCGIYELRVGEWFYIGSSKNPERRVSDHRENLEKGKHKNKLLQRAYDECRSFDWQLLLSCEESEQYAQEQRLIDERWGHPFMANMSPHTLIEDPEVLKKVISDSTKMAFAMRPDLGEAITQRNKDRWNNPAHREKWSEAIRSANRQEERREKISHAMRLRWSDEQNRLDQTAAQQIAWNEEKRQEHAETMRNAFSSEEVRERFAEAAQRRWQSESYAENQSKSQSNSWQDPVIREKRLAGQRRAFEKRRQEKLNKAKEV